MDLSSALSDIKNVVENELRIFFAKKRMEAVAIDSHLTDVVDQITDLTMRGGKKTRPFLVWLGYMIRQQGTRDMQQVDKKLVSAMMAVELFQTFALIHDDIMDEDVERRGGKTVHEYYRTQNSKLNDQSNIKKTHHFGESMAILIGDLSFTWAIECMRNTENDAAIKLFHTMSSQTIYGQTLDILKDQGGETIDTSHIIKYKTAYYSAVRPLQIGASLRKTSQNELKILETYGLAIGYAFQLRDDNLDKRIGDDDFRSQVQVHMDAAEKAAIALHVAPEVTNLMRNVTKFVIERKS